MNSLNDNNFETIKQSFRSSPQFDIINSGNQRFIAGRRRSIAPRRGILRLLIPHAQVIVTTKTNQDSAISVRPDPLAVFMSILLLGGIGTEIFMARSIYPRTYPPEFIYGLAIIYITSLAIEISITRKQVNKLLAQPNS